MFKQRFLILFWSISVVLLSFFSFKYKDASSSIIAEVEPQKHAISFQKAVKVKEIYVVPGQHVKKGEQLLKVERPDLKLDAERLNNELQSLLSKQKINKVEKNNKIYLSKLERESRERKIFIEMEQLKIAISNNNQLASNLEVLNLLPDSIKNADKSYLEKRINMLQKELLNVEQKLNTEMNEAEQVYSIEDEILERAVNQTRQEIALLEDEEKELIQVAHVNGTIGNIYAQVEELVNPYNTLISVYEDNPTIIRALMSEKQSFQVASGEEVIVESTNRKYRIKGNIFEIGSRIIEYPDRLRTFREVPMWGRELFIRIPNESNFLNGEKVFVILNGE
ncbi:HlyD family secretion protein [Chondrinema litorale]|uniref:HlyD family secretion protein n=1 Tax=Chondrinema litorale TaxID=2994555 RepID=UPI0025438DD0|nr:HlyD family efflux transporter periplasmic adaptor subunit [Chondrinema litorale]UZR97602.1 HlyD family efflux transporter periplasmic adaptor subunit [Chondrinema litorale]